VRAAQKIKPSPYLGLVLEPPADDADEPLVFRSALDVKLRRRQIEQRSNAEHRLKAHQDKLMTDIGFAYHSH